MNQSALLHACRLLFGEEVIVDEEFLYYLQPAGLKSAYRRRIRETHPDLLASQAVLSSELFFVIQQAYQLVAGFLTARDHHRFSFTDKAYKATLHSGEKSTKPKRIINLDTIKPIIFKSRHSPRSASNKIDSLYQGDIPGRSLLFGNFLYYSGLTTWRTIAAVLAQQRRDTPRCGELGFRVGILKPSDISDILNSKLPQQYFGEAAIALGLLNEQQLRSLLVYQLQTKKKFGTILLERKLLTPAELMYLLSLFRQHNKNCISR